MNRTTGGAASTPTPSRFGRFWPVLLIVLAGAAVYADSFFGPFVYDDQDGIVENPTIRHLSNLSFVLAPPSGLTVSGRPMVNLTLALNYALGGLDVRGYHALNLAIHILAGLTLFGITRRTLQNAARARRSPSGGEVGPVPANRTARSSALLAFATALLWTVHPLQTEAVTYVIQRAESLMALFYLLTLYCFVRGVEADSGGPVFARRASAGEKAARGASRFWFGLAWLACLFGMATKEVMVSAPVIVLLYDRTFVSGSFREAWRRRRSLYLGLAATWILLGFLVVGEGGGRSASAGFGTGIAWWVYGLTQFEAIAHYLQLAVWPHPLAFDYGTYWVTNVGSVVPFACLVVPLMAATLVALWRWPVWGFLGFWFFSILAPTSLVPGKTQMIVEHRMYLALAPLLAALVCGGFALLRSAVAGRTGAAASPPSAARRDGRTAGSSALWATLLAAAAVACALLTFRRNEDYRSLLILWSDTAAKRPDNALAHNNLGSTLARMPGRLNEAVAEFDTAIRLRPNYVEAHGNRAGAYVKRGEYDRAIADCTEIIRGDPGYAWAYSNRAVAYLRKGELDRAFADCNEAIRLKPSFADAYSNRADAYFGRGDYDRAIADYHEALIRNPNFAEASNNLAWLWAVAAEDRVRDGRKAEDYARKACELTEWKNPDYIDTLAAACAEAGEFAEAVTWETKYLTFTVTQADAASARQRLGLYGMKRAYHEARKPG